MNKTTIKFNTLLRLIYINHGTRPFKNGLQPLLIQAKLGRSRAVDACVHAQALKRTRINRRQCEYQLLTTDFEAAATVCSEAYSYLSKVENHVYRHSRKK